jgi:N-acetylglucosamine kinase-like BadF-type ATPase
VKNIFDYCLGNKCDILLVSDRCSYASGINSLGEKLTIGGWDSKLLDDGSQYYIGLSAIKAAIAEHEMLGGKTILTEQVKNKFKINTLDELKYILCDKKLNDKKILSLSREVLNCAQNGDRISISILSGAADKLFNMVDIIIRRLNMYDCKYDLCLSGSVINFGLYITQPLCDKIYNKYDNIEVFTYNNFDSNGIESFNCET